MKKTTQKIKKGKDNVFRFTKQDNTVENVENANIVPKANSIKFSNFSNTKFNFFTAPSLKFENTQFKYVYVILLEEAREIIDDLINNINNGK